MSAKCHACAARVEPGQPCSTCGEDPVRRESVRYCSVSILDKCSSCGQPIPIDGPLLEHTCGHCQRTMRLGQNYWKLLRDVLADSVESGGALGGFSLNFETDVRYQWTCPHCPKCEKPIPVADIADGADGPRACPSCGGGFDTYPAPDHVRSQASTASQIFFAVRGGGDGPELADDVRPVLFPCPGCGGSLKITARHERIVTCEFCDSDCYLPDPLWLKLHPPRVRGTWYVRYYDAKRAEQRVAEAADRARKKAETQAGYRSIMEGVDRRRGTDPEARSMSTFFSVTSREERAIATKAIEAAMASGWALEPTARAVLTLREIFRASSREEKLRDKLEVLIAERDGPAALELLAQIKVS